jgi:alkyl hydroperoxide reductase subunit AhpC
MIKQRTILGGRAPWAAILVCLLLCGRAAAQANPPGQTATERVIEAHREVQSAVVQVRYGVYFSRTEETEFVTTDYRLVFDRSTKHLRIDRPGFTMISDGTDIVLVADALPGRHLRTPLNGELTYERLIEVFPDLANPTPPALVYLFSKDPVTHFAAPEDGGPSPLAANANAQTRLDFPIAMGSHTQSFNGQARLLEEVLIDLNVQQQDLEAVRFHYAVDWSAVGEAVDDEAFELDLKQSHEFPTLAAFLSPNGGNAQPGPGGQGGGVAQGNTLIGMPLPELELDVLGSDKKIKLSELDEGVVILECFASWSKTSTLDLPALAEFKDWCKENDHAVQVFGVAVGEQPEHMTKWMGALEKAAKKKVDLPILMDTSTEAAMAMKLPTVPRTMIVVDGRVVDVYGGVKPTYLDDLKEGMPGWLEKVKEVKKDEDGPAEE